MPAVLCINVADFTCAAVLMAELKTRAQNRSNTIIVCRMSNAPTMAPNEDYREEMTMRGSLSAICL